MAQTAVPASRTLVLSSRRVPFDVRAHTRGNAAVLVSNAADPYGRVGRAHKADKDAAALSAAGFRVRHLDLRDHRRDRPDALLDAIGGGDLLWVGGGNTFWLVHLLWASGLAERVGDLLDAGVVWGGESAGAVACAPSLAGVEREDDPSLSPDPTQPGLGLVPFLAWAHWNPARPGHGTRHGPLPRVVTPLYRIRDGEYLLVRGGEVQLRTTRPPRPAPGAVGDLTLF